MITTAFIKVHIKKEPVIVNINQILHVCGTDNGSYITMKDSMNFYNVDETVEQIFNKLPKI